MPRLCEHAELDRHQGPPFVLAQGYHRAHDRAASGSRGSAARSGVNPLQAVKKRLASVMFLERLLTQGGPGRQPTAPVRPGVGPAEKGVYPSNSLPIRLA